MSSDVGFNYVLIGEGLSTGIALEFLESQMPLNVQFVSRARGELPWTKVTLTWLLSCVDPHVLLQVTVLVERPLTVGAFVRLGAFMPSPGKDETSSVLELVAALVTVGF